MKFVKSIFIILLLSVAFGCTTLTTQQKTEYALMEKDGVLVQEKNPTTGAVLGILPGFGAFYGREPLVGVVDLLLWPVSIIWDPVVGYEASKKINYNMTVSSLEKERKKKLTEIENLRDLKKIDDVEYVSKKRAIEQEYDYGS